MEVSRSAGQAGESAGESCLSESMGTRRRDKNSLVRVLRG